MLTANATFLRWVGRDRAEIEGHVRLSELLTVGGRIYWETHLSPLLHVDRRLDEVALELRAAAGRLPVLLTAEVDPEGIVQVAVSGARERSRYERELLAARTAADSAEARVRLLQHTTAALSQALGVAAVGDAVLAAATDSLRAASATVWLANGAELVLHSAAGAPAELPPSGAVLYERQPALQDGSVFVPLHGLSQVQGALSVTARSEAGAEPLDLEFLAAVGQQAGLALDRAQRYEHSAGVARELQQSLLAVRPPEDDRFSVATAYRPGVALLEVGGDWYDAFLSEPGVLAVVVGDVVGRGLGAAIAMGQLRSAVRAVAGPDVGPGRLLRHLDRFVGQVEAAVMATIGYVELDLARGTARYACAGHPPPLLLPAEGEPRLLWEGRSTPLGAFLQPSVREEAEIQLRPGDRLLLYTDGLVERRDADLDDRLDLLCRTAARLGPLPLPELVQALTSELLVDQVTADDVCLLLLSWDGGDFERVLSADLSELSTVRHTLSSWLRTRGVDPQVSDDLVLAASEAVANAAEHGASRRPDEHVLLRAAVLAEDVVLSVHDAGQWRPSPPSVERGRGLTIMRGLVDEVLVQHVEGTTVVLRQRLEERSRDAQRE